MKRVDLHIRISEDLFKALKKLREKYQKEAGIPVNMNDLINLLLIKGSKGDS